VRTVGNLAASKAPWEPRLRSALCRARVAAESRFATVAILTLALGIGGTTAIFSVVDPVQMRPLPYAEPERLVSISMRLPSVKLETLTSGISCHSSGKAAYSSAWRPIRTTSLMTNLVAAGAPFRAAVVKVTPSSFRPWGRPSF